MTQPPHLPPADTVCAQCGRAFHCAMASPAAQGLAPTDSAPPCWCAALAHALLVPQAAPSMRRAGPLQATGCFCPACLTQKLAR